MTSGTFFGCFASKANELILAAPNLVFAKKTVSGCRFKIRPMSSTVALRPLRLCWRQYRICFSFGCAVRSTDKASLFFVFAA